MSRGRHQKRRPKRRFGEILRSCLLVIFVIAFFTGAFMTGKTLLERKKAKDAYDSLRLKRQTYAAAISGEADGDASFDNNADVTEDAEEKSEPRPAVSVDFAPLQIINTEIKAWLFAEGTLIDYPVLHTDNNSYYMNHMYNGERNSSGSLFLDYRNTGLFTDRNSVIYGHRMNNGTMFGSLESYKKQDFYESHPTMRLYTPEGDYLIELVCGTVEDGDHEFVQFEFADDNAFLEYVENFRSRSTFKSSVELEPNDRIISLCTCSYEWNNARYMVMGRLTPVMTK